VVRFTDEIFSLLIVAIYISEATSDLSQLILSTSFPFDKVSAEVYVTFWLTAVVF
jgi:hypothetical protein